MSTLAVNTITNVAGQEQARLVQVVNTQTGAVATGTTVMPIDDTIPQNTEGDQYMTLAITPTHASNKLLIEVSGHYRRRTCRNIRLSNGRFQAINIFYSLHDSRPNNRNYI